LAAPAAPAAGGLSREELNPAGQVKAPPPEERDILTAEPPGPCPLADSPLKFTLKSVSFRGATALSDKDLAGAYDGMIGQTLSVGEICEIRDRATRLFFNRGVLARVMIPPQTIQDGAVVFDVVEARVVNVRIRGDAGHAEAAVERYLDKLRGMTPFDMRKAQRYLLLASDVPGVRIRANMLPSVSGGAGEVDLDVTVSARTVDAAANVQNYQSKTIGSWSALARVDVNDLTDFGEQSSFLGYHTLNADGQWVVQWQEQARIGGDGLFVHTSLAYGQSRPGGALAPLHLQADSLVGQIELGYPIVRLRHRDLSIAGGFEGVDETTDTGPKRLFDEDLRVLYVRADGDAQVRALDRLVQVTGSVSVRKGLTGDDTPFLARTGAEADAWLVRGSGSLSVFPVSHIQFVTRFQGQYSPDRLFDYEQLALGDLTVGRGYDPASVLGDSGASASFDLRYVQIPIATWIHAAPYVFYDVGYVHNNGNLTPETRTLTSAGVGVTLNLNNRANLDVLYAQGFQAPLPGGSRPTPRILFSLTANF
jgi:hemolysin activation/secretion protein